MADELEHAAQFARISAELMREPSEEPTLQRIVEQAVQVVPACEMAGVMVRRGREQAESAAWTEEVVHRSDELQLELGQGPCLESLWHDTVYVSPDLRAEARWPAWAEQVVALGINSAVSVRLATEDDGAMGALNLFATRPGAFSEEDLDLAAVFASHAARAMGSARLVSGLQTALHSRHVIGMAQGILMARHGLDVDRSFALLRRYSNHLNRRLRDLAEEIVEAGALPGFESRSPATPDPASPSPGPEPEPQP